MKRVGFWRFLDVLAFRFYYQAVLARRDQAWEKGALDELCSRFPELPKDTPILYSASPNTAEAREFIRRAQPDLMIARCKALLKEEVFTIPTSGTLVMHPGVCPEYRNAHGCFWALANRDMDRVGMTLLRVDRGVDTGPVFGYYSYAFDERSESHIVIQSRVVFDNLDALRLRLEEIAAGSAIPVPVAGRKSQAWGQPWLSRYLAWKRVAAAR